MFPRHQQRVPELVPAQMLLFQSASPPVTTYHLQRALPGGIVLMELAFQVSGNRFSFRAKHNRPDQFV